MRYHALADKEIPVHKKEHEERHRPQAVESRVISRFQAKVAEEIVTDSFHHKENTDMPLQPPRAANAHNQKKKSNGLSGCACADGHMSGLNRFLEAAIVLVLASVEESAWIR